MKNMTPANVSFERCGNDRTVTLNGRPAGTIRRFTKFDCDAWTYDDSSISLVGPLREIKATLRRHAAATAN